MEMSPEGTSSKRGRAKPKIVVKSSAAPAAPASAKKPRAPRKTLTTKAAATATEAPVVATAVEPSTEELGGMIATAAYYLAAARNFTPGHELDDWLEAERSVRAQHWG